MNLADAIRQAASLRKPAEQSHEAPAKSPEPQPVFQIVDTACVPDSNPGHEDHVEVVPIWGSDTGKLTIETSPDEALKLLSAEVGEGTAIPAPESTSFGGGNAVRFEIFLSPDQLSCLFRALVSTQHSMLTLREAAHYLRIPSSSLEQLAAEGKIPALQIEGRWRFPKTGIDEWVMLQSFREGEVGDAA